MKKIYLKQPTDTDFSVLEGQTIRSIETDGDNAALTDQALLSVSRISGLEELDLEWAVNITDVGLSYLHSLQSLKYLDLSFCEKLSFNSIARLKQAIPGIEIEN